MQSYKGSDFLEAGTLSRSRSTSLSSDSQHPRVNLMSPPSVRPAPAFISSSAASEIITSDQEFNAADFAHEDEETGAGANALVTPAALSLLNGFLDNLLFNILAGSKSTQLACIRPALADVLKPRLASEVVATADEELSEYMGGAEDEQTEFRGGHEPGGDFDLVRSWKLTRLRCMVYTRLGDMEEEDEDEFIAQEGLGENDGAPRRFTSHVDNITPAAAIFLTSIIEHIGERALVIAGETARSRLSAKLNDGQDDETDEDEDRKRIDRLVVEDLDMEKLALNATLGRLWRTWRKRRRNTTLARTLSRESFRRRGYTQNLANSRKSSVVTIEEPMTPQEPLPEELPAPVDPATVPLPIGDWDVQEIEVPGFSAELEGEVQTMEAVVAHKVRPRSLMVFCSPSLGPRSPGSTGSPLSAGAIDNKSLRHARSRSLPNAAASPPRQTSQKTEPAATADQPSPRTSEEKKQLETMYEDDESAEFVDAAETAPGTAITTSHEEVLEQSAAESAEKDRMSVVQEEEEEQPAPAAVSTAGPPVNETVASLRSWEDDEDEAATDHSARVSVASLDDRPAKDTEVIEGQGLCEKPKLTSTIHRPRRKPSKDPALLNAKPIIAETSEPDVNPVVDTPPATQGVDSAPTPSGATVEAIDSPRDQTDVEDRDQHISVTTSTPATAPVNDEVMLEKPSETIVEEPVDPTESTESVIEESTVQEAAPVSESPRPASATGSERSQRSRRHKPSPLVVTPTNRTSPKLEQRAAVQRMPRPNNSVSSTVQTKTRRSESVSSARDRRPLTAGSTTSQVSSKLKGLMNRPQAESPSLRLRSSSETSRASGSAGSIEHDATDLDKLINSDETIHFTLTPRSVREMHFPDIPRQIPRSDTTDTTDLAEFIKNTGPPGEEPLPRTSVSSRNTADANALGRTKSIESPKHIPIASRMTLPPKSPAREVARTAGTPTSVRDMVETKKISSPTSSVPQAGSPVRPPSSFSTNTNNTSRSNPNRPRLQARPAETRGSQTSELIDFIREGPPQPGAHRIPRTVAPFRNTIDSDDIHFDSATDKDHGSSFASGSTPNKSMTSLGSRTGLLDSSNRANGQAKPTPMSSAMDDDDRPVPVRKQRRIPGRAPDPYAIDDDDDDDLLEELINAKPPKREEESLIDFLRSAPPPDFEQQQPQPLNISIPSKPNGTGMKSRLMRSSTSADKVPSSKMSISSLRSQSTLNSQHQQSSNYSYKVGMARNPGIHPSTTNRQTETSALADFLRNTGPPEPPVGRDLGAKGKEGGLSRFFIRRKKMEA
ncbi:uncharacterized protein N7496_002508 [Penicillium cataractarum]|uniref:Uncharacterized protein n=1 Tax=Penicillium cataractarum TaxID=2100454 RepID=A0A9W9VHX3_9EURO|nr:uncharacterized protein N7496_002508 [Penicillium cataractarum]KAJ5380080.1 hypothetical protein N7496_002508 [Penicillium cataractarum]